jgi:SAM-dependent methyltransferase
MNATKLEACVACGSRRWMHEQEWHGYQLAHCLECFMTFTLNPDYSGERYAAAYGDAAEGTPVPSAKLHVYRSPERRLTFEGQALFAPPPRLTPSERRVLSWLKRNAPPTGSIVDCGCGTGRFLDVLSRAGFRTVGLELSDRVVGLLRARGFDARFGMAPDFPWEGPDPFAITFFEVLEHLSDPGSMLARLRERFPGTHILATVPSPRRASLLTAGVRDAVDFPPNHFLRWSPEALEILFQRLGYSEVRIELPAPTGSELMPGVAQLLARFHSAGPIASGGRSVAPTGPTTLAKRALVTLLLLSHRLYQGTMDVVGAPKAIYWRRKGATSSSMFVIASP